MKAKFIPIVLVLIFNSVSDGCQRGSSQSEGVVCKILSPESWTGWGWPVNLGPNINTPEVECAPAISFDGQWLYFEAERQEGYGGNDIYVSHWNGTDWELPVNLGPAINTQYGESKPTLSAGGDSLFFISARLSGYGRGDIYMSTWQDSGWGEPQLLPAPPNSPFGETSPYLSADGTELFFSSSRAGGYGWNDLYVSRWNGSQWSAPQNLGPHINTSNNEWYCCFSPDRTKLYFIVDRPGGWGNIDIWESTRTDSGWALPVNLGGLINTRSPLCSPSITSDGATLYFGGGGPDSYGDLDLWQSHFEGEPTVRRSQSPDSGWVTTADLPGAEVVLSLLEASDGTIYAGTYPYGRVFKSFDRGRHWEETAELPGAIMVYSLLERPDSTILAGTFPHGDLFATSNGGQSWEKLSRPPFSTEIRSLLLASNAAIYAGTAPNGKIFKSFNGGANWIPTGDLQNVIVPWTIYQGQNGILYAGTVRGMGVFRSLNWGGSWEKIGEFRRGFLVFDSPSIASLLQTPDGTLFAGMVMKGHGSTGGVFKSTDGGEVWDMCTHLPACNGVWALLQTSDGAILAGLSTIEEDIVYRSEDGGQTWSGTGNLAGAREVFCLLQDSHGSIYAGTAPNGDVFKLSVLKKGDVNGDGTIDVVDVVMCVNIILGLYEPTPDQIWRADYNEDGEVDVLDVVLIVNVILEGG